MKKSRIRKFCSLFGDKRIITGGANTVVYHRCPWSQGPTLVKQWSQWHTGWFIHWPRVGGDMTHTYRVTLSYVLRLLGGERRLLLTSYCSSWLKSGSNYSRILFLRVNLCRLWKNYCNQHHNWSVTRLLHVFYVNI